MKNLFWSLLALAFMATSLNAQTRVKPCYQVGTNVNSCQDAPASAVTTNSSVVIATGNTFQTILATSTKHRSLTIENNNATDNCWVFIGAGSATAATSILLLPGGSYARYYPYIPSDVIQATCASTSDTLYVDTQ
jgi:hypothetical protein